MRNKLRKFSIIFGIIFFAVVAVLTYSANAIEHMMLPRVSVADINSGTIADATQTPEDIFLIPISSVIEDDSGTYVNVVRFDKENTGTAHKAYVDILDNNDIYYEVQMNGIYAMYSVIYEWSRDLEENEVVVVEEE